MLRRVITLSISLIIVISSFSPGKSWINPFISSMSPVRLIQSNASDVVLYFNTPDYVISSDSLSGGDFKRISIPDFETTTESGKPQLPKISVLIGIPPKADIKLTVLNDEVELLTGQFQLIPAPKPGSLSEDLQPGRWIYEPDRMAYASDKEYPSSPVILSPDAWVRDQRIVRVVFYPFQYIPLQGKLFLHHKLRVRVDFLNPGNEISSALPLNNTETNGQSDSFDALLEGMLINGETARTWRQLPPLEDSQNSSANPASGITGPLYKIIVDHDGLYKMTPDDLRTAGMDVGQIDPTTFHLSSEGQDVAIYVAGEADQEFNNGDYIAFYGQKFNGERLAQQYADENINWVTYTQQLTTGVYVPWHPAFNATMAEKYTDKNVYWLTVGGTPGPRMAKTDASPVGSSAPVPSSYLTTVHAEQSMRWLTWHFTGEDTWFWDIVQDWITHSYTTTLTALATEAYSATVRGEVVATNTNDSNSPDHHTRFTLNTRVTPLSDALWDGKSRFKFESQIPQSALVEGVNQLQFVNINSPSSVLYPYMGFDWFEIDYNRRFQAENNKILFPGEAGGARKYRIGGFMSLDIQIYEVTSPLTPTQIVSPSVSGSGPYTVTFAVTPTLGAQYFAVGSTAVQTPEISIYSPADLSSSANGADYIFITHPDFITTAQVLADYRSSQGLRTRVINIDDIINEFNNGIYHPIAIKNFLAYAFYHWQPPAPSYVLLVGDGTWNFKQFNTGRYGSETIYMPPNLGWVDPWQGEVDATNLLATIVGNDPIPDLFIGRLPVNSAVELDAVINKIIDYEQTPNQDWQRNFTFVADNVPDPAGDFEASAEYLISNYVKPGFTANRIYVSDYCPPTNPPTPCPAAKAAITSTLNTTGTLLMTYIGHGAVQNWSKEQIFTNNDIPLLNNSDQLPLIFSLTCMDGYWIGPHGPISVLGPSLIEEIVRADAKGAVSAFAPGGLGVSTGHDSLARGFYKSIFEDGNWILGPATLSARLSLFASGSNFDLINTYNIIGDPALRLLNPYSIKVTPTSATQSGSPGMAAPFTFQVKNSGAITDTFDLTITGNVWPTIVPSVVGPLSSNSHVNMLVSVQIPAGLSPGSADRVVISITSRGNREKIAIATLTTIVSATQIFMPFVNKK